MASIVAPWLARTSRWLSLQERSMPDPLGDSEDLVASVWLSWVPLKRTFDSQWIWMLETMELLDLFTRVDHAAAWTLVLDAIEQSVYVPLIAESSVPLRFSTVITDRLFLERSFVLNEIENGRMPELLNTHTPGFTEAKRALLAMLPPGFKRNADTRIPIWIIQSPDEQHRITHRAERLLSGLVTLAEWWLQQQQQHRKDPPAACFRWSRLSLDCFDKATLDRLAPSTVRRLVHLGIEVDVLTVPTNELPTLLRASQQLKLAGSRGGLRKVQLPNINAPSDQFRDACLAIYQRRNASLDVTFGAAFGKEIETNSIEAEDLERRWQWLALALWGVSDPLDTVPLRRVLLIMEGFTDSHAAAIEQALTERDAVFPELTAMDTTESVAVKTSSSQKNRRMGAMLFMRLWLHQQNDVDAVVRLIRLAGSTWRRFQLNTTHEPAERCELVLRTVLDFSASLDRLDVRYCALASFTWLTEPHNSRLRILSLRSISLTDNGQGLRALMKVLSDSTHPLSRQLERLEVDWPAIQPHFDALLDMLACNSRLDRCVLWGITSVTNAFTTDHDSLFKAHEVLVARQQAPLSLRTRLAFLSVVRRSLNSAKRPHRREVATPVVSLIFEFAAPCKRRQCLAFKEIDGDYVFW